MHLPSAISNALAFANAVSLSGANSSACSSTPLSLKCVQPELKHLESVCEPRTANTTLELDFPCRQHDIISNQCYWGRTFHEIWNTTAGDYIIGNDTWSQQSPENQRLCACESHFFDSLVGCSACYQAHGANNGFFYSDKAVSSMSSAYCAVTNTPTVGLDRMMLSWDNHRPGATSMLRSDKAQAKTSSYSDPLSGKTAVSLYYTPTITGNAVFNIAEVTHGAMPTTTNVVHGQITNGAGVIGGGLAITKVALAAVLAFVVTIALL